MGRIVLDTNVVSYLVKDDSRGRKFRRSLDGNLVIVSFMTLAELERWSLARNWGTARREAMLRYLTRFTP
jgi:tRNA(fMet)-specific endonuclease VapC